MKEVNTEHKFSTALALFISACSFNFSTLKLAKKNSQLPVRKFTKKL